MVEAIEDQFIPVVIFNNKKEDEELLKSFSEPAWNNPVVRFLDGDGKDLIPRKDSVWQVAPLAERMYASLEAAGRKPPAYLRAMALGWRYSLQRASFAML
ncbi:MAG: hypothetical protein GY819_10625 [Planctomycetaceae bacterium]|nr:hypothetical protein [Planctomycetaceae bacterium]MCP4463238.1 hypothetical protein [Planctomycetaceae bacterium]